MNKLTATDDPFDSAFVQIEKAHAIVDCLTELAATGDMTTLKKNSLLSCLLTIDELLIEAKEDLKKSIAPVSETAGA